MGIRPVALRALPDVRALDPQVEDTRAARLLPRELLVYYTDTGSIATLTSIQGDNIYLYGGQISSTGQFDYMVWAECTPLCNVYFQEAAKDPKKLPNTHAKEQYAPSVSPVGRVYFARSGQKCGTHVQFVRWESRHKERVVASLPKGDDLIDTYAMPVGPEADVFFDRIDCDGGADIYKLVGA